MDWTSFWSGLLCTIVPAFITSIVVLHLTKNMNAKLEQLRKDVQFDVVKFTRWHEKKAEALTLIYDAFCKYLDFIRLRFYIKNNGMSMDPEHEFRRIIERNAVYLDEPIARQIEQFHGELLVFCNWAISTLSEKGEGARAEVQHRLDYDIPRYLLRLRKLINSEIAPRGEAIHKNDS